VQAALESVDGVDGVEIDYPAKTATITIEGQVDMDEVMSALDNAGYGASVSEVELDAELSAEQEEALKGLGQVGSGD
jgi:hypothetical protein